MSLKAELSEIVPHNDSSTPVEVYCHLYFLNQSAIDNYYRRDIIIHFINEDKAKKQEEMLPEDILT